MKLIKDLGMRNTGKIRSDSGKYRYSRYGLYMCNVCGKTKEKQISKSSKESLMCRSCRSKKVATKHGFTDKDNIYYSIYVQWQSMNRRCSIGNSIVCDEWKSNPKNFIEWAISNGWSKGLHLDKDIICEKENISPKVYSPYTCMWITGSENSKESSSRNNSKNKSIPVVMIREDSIDQEFSSAVDAESKTGICRSSISKCCKHKQKTAGGYKWKYKT